jgi:ribosomal protein S17
MENKGVRENRGVKKGRVVMNHQRLSGTIGVIVNNTKKRAKYSFFDKSTKRFLVHLDVSKFSDEELSNPEFLLNKFVLIKSCAPVSKHKRFELLEVVK